MHGIKSKIREHSVDLFRVLCNWVLCILKYQAALQPMLGLSTPFSVKHAEGLNLRFFHWQYLEKAGLKRYEVANFAREVSSGHCGMF